MHARYAADAALDDRVACLVDQMLSLESVRDWKNALKRELAGPTYALETLHANPEAPLRRVLESLGLVASLKRVVVDLHDETTRLVHEAAQRQAQEEEATLVPRGSGNELDVVAAARERWEKITRDELLRSAREQSRPLLSRRDTSEKASVDVATARASGEDDAVALPGANATRTSKPAPSTRFLYDSNDLLHILQAIQPVNRSTASGVDTVSSWGSIQLQFHAPSTLALRRTFAELAPVHGQIGVDDTFPLERHAFVSEKLRVGDVVTAAAHHHSVAMARQYAKTGCPTSLRAAVWRQALGLRSPFSTTYFEMLETQVSQWRYATDDMYLLDLQRAVDASDYFVFQDPLERVVMAFTRDAAVCVRASQVNGAVRLSDAEFERLTSDSPSQPPMNAMVPPNGVLPFSGLVLYVAPLAYVYGDDAPQLYIVFRELYVKYWSRLNAVAAVLPLCRLFEELVQRSSPAAVSHLLTIGLSPLNVVFPWLQGAFSGVLEIQQVLLLWDRVVGFDALELLAVCAAALFHWRASEWEHVATMEDARALYAELLDVQVVPLLQEYLFLLV